jgi:CBS-domain-containing membrane protein
MAENDLDHLPVVDREMQVVGIVSRKEIAEMASGNAERQRISRRAMEIARQDGRVAFTDDDFEKATAELAEPVRWPDSEQSQRE